MKNILIIYLIYVLLTAVIMFYPQKNHYETNNHKLNWHKRNPGEYLVLVEDRFDSLLTRIDLINKAEESIDICYYSIHDTDSSDIILSMLIEAAERGVKVRIIIDDLLQLVNPKLKKLIPYFKNNPNIKYKTYEKFNLFKPWTWNNRQHEKMFIVDGKYAVIGGRNIADKYYSPDENAEVVNDRDVMLVSEDGQGFTKNTQNHYNELWNHPFTKEANTRLYNISASTQLADELKQKLNSYRKAYPEFFNTNYDYSENKISYDRISYIYNPYERWNKEPRIWQSVIELMEKAEESIIIQTPYWTPNKAMTEIFPEANVDCNKISIYTNSLKASPNLTAWSAYAPQRDKWIQEGIDIYEYTNKKQSQHAKMFMIDEETIIVGSFNTDPRSSYLNSELMLIIESKELATAIKEENKENLEKHYEKIEEAQKIEAKPFKKFALQLVRFITAPFRHLL